MVREVACWFSATPLRSLRPKCLDLSAQIPAPFDRHATIPSPTLHLISGLPASGKTTYAARLRADVHGVLYCLDKWLITLFGKYTIPDVGLDEHTRRVLACRELIWESASELLRRSVDVILDDGFFYREHRMSHVAMAADVGAIAKIHFVETPLDLVRGRLDGGMRTSRATTSISTRRRSRDSW